MVGITVILTFPVFANGQKFENVENEENKKIVISVSN